MRNLLLRQRTRVMRVSYIGNLVALRRNARLYLFSVLLSGLGFAITSLFFNLYVLSLGESRQFLGLLQALSSGTVFVVGIPAGLAGDRLGCRRAMLIGGGSGLLAHAVFLMSSGQPLMVFWTVVQAAGNAFFWVNIAPFLMQNSADEERAFLFSADFGLMSLSAFFGTLIAGGLPAALAVRMVVQPESAEAYRAAMFVGAGLELLAMVPLWLTRETRWPGPRTVRKFRLANTLRLEGPVMKLMLPNLFFGFGTALLIPYMNLFFKERFLVDDQTLGRIFAPSGLLTALTIMAAPALAARWGKIRTVVSTALTSVVSLLVLGFVPLLPLATVAFWARGALMNMGYPLFAAFSMEQTAQEERATVNSIREMAWQVGWMVGPLISTTVQTRAGFSPLYVATALLYGLGAGLTYAFFRNAERMPGPVELPIRGEPEIMV